MESDVGSNSWLPFEHLIGQLRRKGFRIGVEHSLRLQMLLDQVGGECCPSDLKTMICPLFATNAQQQESFYREFDACYPFLTVGGPNPATQSDGGDAAPHVTLAPATRRYRALAIGLLFTVLATAIALATWRANSHQSPPGASSTRITESEPPLPSIVRGTPRFTFASWYASRRVVFGWAAVAGPLAFWLAWELYRFRRRHLSIRKALGKLPPYAWSVRPDVTPEIYEPQDIAAVSRRLHRRYQSESERLDLTGTIAASIASFGFPTFRYRRDSQLPEYLFLIDRAGFRDHQSHLYDYLATVLRAQGLHVSTWFFEGDPRVCWSASGEDSAYLEQLQRACPEHRLLVFSTGEALLDAVSGELSDWHREFDGWRDRAILTPAPPSAWYSRELTLSTAFNVVPATLEGLRTLAAYFDWSDASSGNGLMANRDQQAGQVPRVNDELAALRRYLNDDVFQWLCACAIYPELQWGLTLSLGALPSMATGLVCEESLSKLLQLDWFRNGSIPDDRRRELIAELDPSVERDAREAIIRMLEGSAAPEQTFAATAQHFQIAFQRAWLAPRDRKARAALKAAIEEVPPDDIGRDYAYLEELDSLSRSPLQLSLPRRLRKMLYPAGARWLGVRSSVRLLVTLIIAAAATQGLRITDRLLATSSPQPSVRVPPSPPPTSTVSSGPTVPDASRAETPPLAENSVLPQSIEDAEDAISKADREGKLVDSVYKQLVELARPSGLDQQFIDVWQRDRAVGGMVGSAAALLRGARARLDAARRDDDSKKANDATRDALEAFGQFHTVRVLAETARDRLRSTVAANPNQPSATPPPISSPGEQLAQSAAETAITSLLSEYVSALQSRDLVRLKRIWPGLSSIEEGSVRNEFAQVTQIVVKIIDPRITLSGDKGTVTFVRNYQVVLLKGQSAQIDTDTTMEVQRAESGWIIVRMRFSPRR